MKDIRQKLVEMLKEGHCTPRISSIAKRLKVPATTIHYNIKRLEKEGAIKSYKSVFNYREIGQGHCTYVLVNLVEGKYGDPEEVAKEIAKNSNVESVDIVTGDYELILKLRSRDIDDYYSFVKFAIKKYGFAKAISLTSLKQIKTEFVTL
ncbi:Lrp/AsnC family transcriptional regulator [Candidatus Woesearchaeota archaeon]|nr:Lrp/AsnC family transcriptional regulator [Candidatus Woesearchaeota archaeon]